FLAARQSRVVPGRGWAHDSSGPCFIVQPRMKPNPQDNGTKAPVRCGGRALRGGPAALGSAWGYSWTIGVSIKTRNALAPHLRNPAWPVDRIVMGRLAVVAVPELRSAAPQENRDRQNQPSHESSGM